MDSHSPTNTRGTSPDQESTDCPYSNWHVPSSRPCKYRMQPCLDLETKSIRVRSLDESYRIPYDGHALLEEVIQDGYQLDSEWLLRKDAHGIALFKDKDAQLSNLVLVVIDLRGKHIVATFDAKSLNLPPHFDSMDVFDFAYDVSSDSLALVYGVLSELGGDNGTYNSQLLIYNVASMTYKIVRNKTSLVFHAVQFNKRSRPWGTETVLILAGIAGQSRKTLIVQTVAVDSGDIIKQERLPVAADLQAETWLRLNLSNNRRHLVFQILEPLSCGCDYDCQSYVLNPWTLQIVTQCVSSMVTSCHFHCVPDAPPLFSPCGSQMALPDTMNPKHVTYSVVYLPMDINLKNLAKAAILKGITNSSEVAQLPLPHLLQDYITFNDS